MITISTIEKSSLAAALQNKLGTPELEKLKRSAEIAVNTVLKVKKDEQVLIIANPAPASMSISASLYDAASQAGGKPTLLVQPIKTQLDFAEESVIAAFSARPEVVLSISAGKLGKDEKGISEPYQWNGTSYDHVFHLLQYGEKVTRAFWSPSLTIDSFIRTVPIDYALLKKRALLISEILNKAESVHVSAPGGTDIRIGLTGRIAKVDDGDFSAPGSGGNLPAGETFISPENNTAEGLIVFDGAISVNQGDILIQEPIRCTVHSGFVTDITGGAEADALRETIALAEINAQELYKSGKLSREKAELYAKNARNIGEFGIGLNPEAHMSGNMLEDEKAFKTCHFAIGQNYDEDAPSLIHLDGLVRNPTINARFSDKSECLIEKDGELLL
ncbi:MAG: aminopeptidase [Spirochaetaceae bacterium]|jgi:leucyl aminopeptidase (aminopeptidase T)|nr:aminopeptidase [Spirochaetaceae bacterium]